MSRGRVSTFPLPSIALHGVQRDACNRAYFWTVACCNVVEDDRSDKVPPSG